MAAYSIGMRLCIFGAGAVGGHIAAKLATGAHEVSVVARGEHLEAMRRDGIRLLHGSRTIVGRVRAAAEARELGAQDAVFVTLKANLLRAFAAQCAPLLGSDTAVVFVQNGIPWWYDERLLHLDPDRALARAIARERVVGAVAYSANEIVAPGVIENHVPGNNMLVIGRPDCEETPLVRALREALERRTCPRRGWRTSASRSGRSSRRTCGPPPCARSPASRCAKYRSTASSRRLPSAHARRQAPSRARSAWRSSARRGGPAAKHRQEPRTSRRCCRTTSAAGRWRSRRS